jgi:OmpA-OmpF porin, OOP family
MKIKTALLATALTVAVSGLATAQPFNSQNEMTMGPYISLGGGVNWVQSSEYRAEDLFNLDMGDLAFKTGWTANGALGYAFGFGPRVELEVSYRRNKMKDGTFGNGFCTGAEVDDDFSRMSQLGIMANGAYDIYLGLPIVPYVGAGVGAVRTKFRVSSECIFVDEHEQWRLAVQAFGGLDFFITQQLRLGVRYTFLHTNDLDGINTFFCCGPNFSEGAFDPNNHAITAQIAFNFGGPPQLAAVPPPPPPPPPLQRNFLVFFDFDKSDITPEADRVIVQAANNARTATVTRITLTGHADRSGPVAYNQRLSERRANAVAARLVREGIPPSAIVTIGRGETQPLVPTADGVREPQNRRVEIVF